MHKFHNLRDIRLNSSTYIHITQRHTTTRGWNWDIWQTVNYLNSQRKRVHDHVTPMAAVSNQPLLADGDALFLNVHFQTHFNIFPSGCRASVVTYRTAWTCGKLYSVFVMNTHSQMAAPCKRKDLLLQYLKRYIAHSVQFSVKFQTGHSILNTLLEPARQIQHFFLRHQ